MNETVLFSPNSLMEVNHRRQLKVIMNLPVRLICEDKVMDVLPLSLDPIGINGLAIRKRMYYNTATSNWSADEMIAFFQSCELGSLMTPQEVADHYGISKCVLSEWASHGLLKNYRISSSITFYKKAELPGLDFLYLRTSK